MCVLGVAVLPLLPQCSPSNLRCASLGCHFLVCVQNSGDAERAAHYLANTVGLLKQRMMQLFDNGTNRGYAYAYQAMAMLGRDQPCLASMHEQNKLKNRFAYLNPYSSRLVLLDLV